jgi:hypothetical protein
LQVAHSSEKRKFLRGKGVTDEEIDEAFRRAAAIVQQEAQPSPTTGDLPPLIQDAQPLRRTQDVALQPQATWAQRSASVALVALAACGVGTLLTPIAKRCWRYWRGSEEPADLRTQLKELFEQLVKDQGEHIAHVTNQATTAVQQIKVWTPNKLDAHNEMPESKPFAWKMSYTS